MKHFAEYGVANSENIVREANVARVPVEKVARGFTYTTRDDDFPPTRLIWPDNPFNEAVKNAEVILDVGCGVGRNLPFIYDNTNANYIGLDPNPVMLEHFWTVTDRKYQTDRVVLVQDINTIADSIDVVVSTFVFQHLGFRAPNGVMNVTDITQKIMEHTHPGSVWILYEHEREEGWISRWMTENGVTPDVYVRDYTGWPELLHRGSDAHLIIWKQLLEKRTF